MEWFWSDWTDEARLGETNDPLGLQAAAVAVAGALVPGFSGATARARSLSLLLGGAALVADADPDQQRMLFERFDRLCVHRVAVDGDSPATWISLKGVRAARARRDRRHHRTLIDLEKPLGQSSTGPAWSYRRLAAALGLLDLDAPGGVGKPTETGAALGKAALQRLGLPTADLKAALHRGQISPTVLKRLNIDRACSKSEASILRDALRSYTEAVETYPFRRLGRTVDRLDRRHLSKRQLQLLNASDRLAWLVDAVENPFRQRVGVEASPSIRGYRRACDEATKVAEVIESFAPGPHTAPLRRLVAALDGGAKMADLSEHHRRLMASRGRPAWEEARPPRGQGQWSDDDTDAGEDVLPLDGRTARESTPAFVRILALLNMVEDCRLEGLA